MDKALIVFPITEHIQAHTKMDLNLGMEYLHGQMVKGMKVIGKKVDKMELESTLTLKER